MRLNHVFAVATAALLLGGCGLRPFKPAVTEKLEKLDALYGEAVVIYPAGSKQSQKDCTERPNFNLTVRRICEALPESDEVTVNVTSSFWGGVYKVTLLIPSNQGVQKGDIIKFHTRDSVFGFIKVAARAGDPNCKWQSGVIKGSTAQGVVCEDYDYRKVIEILEKYQ